MDSKITELINKQINMELFSAYLYFEFRNYYSDINLDGFENWYHVQSQEEIDHALIFTKYLQNNDQRVITDDIKRPVVELKSAEDPLKLAYSHEKSVTANIHHIYGIAFENKDFRTTQLLDWFIQEQGEEEKSASDLIAKMNLFGNDSKGLYLLNNELLSRVYTAPTLTL